MKALLLLFLSFQAWAENVKFEDIPRLVGERNQHAQGAKLQQKASELSKGHLARSFLPHVGARIGRETAQTGTQDERGDTVGAIEGKINLFRGGRDSLENRLVIAKVDAVSAEVAQILRDEVKKARQSYWQLISLREQVALVQHAVQENGRNQRAAEARIRAGLATATDRIEFEMQQIALDQDLARLTLSASNTERELAILIGLPEGQTIQTSTFVGHEHSDQLLETKYKPEEHPSVFSLRARSVQADLERSTSGRWWTPSLDAYASYGLHPFREREYLAEKERYETVVGVQLSIELFDGLKGRKESLERRMMADAFRFEAEQTERELSAKVEGAKAELKLTHDLIHQSEDALKRAGSYLTRTLDEYRRGVKNSPDVLSASERNLQMKRRFAELRRDYQIARVELLEILGK